MGHKLNGSDYIGSIFGRLKVVSIAPKNDRSCEMVLCTCSCLQTNETTAYALHALLSGNTKTCGCRGIPAIGFINYTKDNLEYTVQSYIKVGGVTKAIIKFSKTGTECVRNIKEVVNGSVKDLYHPNIAGVGFLGEGIYKTNGVDKVCYQSWNDMIIRCYAAKLKRVEIEYKDVFVCEHWHNFQNFAPWYYAHHVEGWQVDKDFLVRGNKLYSKDTCLFLPPELNSFLTGGLKYGVHFSTSKNKWVAQCQDGELTKDGNKKQTYLGSFSTKSEASLVYKDFKLSKLEILRNKFNSVVPDIIFTNIHDIVSDL